MCNSHRLLSIQPAVIESLARNLGEGGVAASENIGHPYAE